MGVDRHAWQQRTGCRGEKRRADIGAISRRDPIRPLPRPHGPHKHTNTHTHTHAPKYSPSRLLERCGSGIARITAIDATAAAADVMSIHGKPGMTNHGAGPMGSLRNFKERVVNRHFGGLVK